MRASESLGVRDQMLLACAEMLEYKLKNFERGRTTPLTLDRQASSM